jgi:hypothetical protein
MMPQYYDATHVYRYTKAFRQ